MTLNIGMDIDGVLANFHYGFSKVANQLFASPIVKDINEIKAYRWEDWGYPLDKKQHNKVWREIDNSIQNFWFNLESLITNKEFSKLQHMANKGHNFFFITSRKNTAGNSALFQTKKWIEYKLKLTNFSVIPSHRKGGILDRAEVDYFIDDLPENIIEAAIEAPKCKSFLLVRPYNAYAIEFIQKSHKFKNIGIVYSVEEFLDTIEKNEKF